jgi:Dehydrogenases with different specificities (related to short-chain alcohol dehydrogenases)
MDLRLSGKTVLITGGSRGTGLAIARNFLSEGARVAISARTGDTLTSAAEDLRSGGGDVLAIAGDWRVTDDVNRVVSTVIKEFGVIDIFVPNAGDAPPGDFESMDDEKWLHALNLKLMGHIRGCRAVLPHMVERRTGAITMVVGNDGLKPPFAEVVPGACNAADINVASSLAEKYGYLGIRINTVNPGPIATTRWDWCEETMGRERGLSASQVRKLVDASLPRGYVCKPEEVADVVVFLSSERASYVNGAHVPVDGAQRKALMYADMHFSV